MANTPKQGANKSGQSNKDYASSTLGGFPEKKNKDQIEKANSPRANGRAPGSVRK